MAISSHHIRSCKKYCIRPRMRAGYPAYLISQLILDLDPTVSKGAVHWLYMGAGPATKRGPGDKGRATMKKA